jgi:TonB family protein
MALRCLLFCSDQETAESICPVLVDLGVEAEHCIQAVVAAERVSSQPFRIVIVDWDKLPDAADLLHRARERKASERPLTLAIVSDDPSVPKALQAGANSILRRPLLANQVKDTLTTARDLLRARESAASAVAQAAAASSASMAADVPGEPTLRAGEFLQTSPPASTTQFDTESEMQKSIEQSAAQEVDQLKDLEPMAAVIEEKPAPPPPLPSAPAPDEPRGLQWYLNQRAAAAAPAPVQIPPPTAAPARPELLGYDQTPESSPAQPAKSDDSVRQPAPASGPQAEREQKAEAELFSYIAGERDEPDKNDRPGTGLGKRAIVAALILAAGALAGAPQAPWHPRIRAVWAKGQHALQAWLNPQPVTPVQAPAAHEDFGRAGDEYKLPVAESIPDATTDPSQIRVVPMVDPTAKKPNSGGGSTDPNLAPTDGTAANPADATQTPGAQTPTQGQSNQGQGDAVPDNPPQGNPSPQTAPVVLQPAVGQSTSSAMASPAATVALAAPPHSDPFAASRSTPVAVHPVPPKSPPPRPASAGSTPAIPSSLKSQMTSMVPDASGNKAPETALPSIEPVAVPEATERALLTDQPAMDYPANAKTQQGTVVLQVLVGRDGTVQDAKFLQGSLAFARTAIDGVKRWKFKPYIMNGRAVSVQTSLTIPFKPGQ